MSPLTVYTYRNCSTCRQATTWLRAHDISFVEKPIRDTPPTPAELTRMLRYVDGSLRRLFNTSGRDYRAEKLGEALPTMTEADAIARLAANGNLVKRPFLLGADCGLVGFKENEWAARLAN